MKINSVICLLSVILFLGCGEKELLPVDYVQWVENPENGLCIEQQKEEYKFKLQYQPIAYTVINELRQKELKRETLEEATKKKEGLQYFTFKMSTMQNKAVFSGNSITDSISNYLNYGIKNDFYLIEEKDTLSCKLFHYENTNGIIPYDMFVLGFEASTDSITDKTVLFKADLLELDWIKINIKKSAINKIPKVKTL